MGLGELLWRGRWWLAGNSRRRGGEGGVPGEGGDAVGRVGDVGWVVERINGS